MTTHVHSTLFFLRLAVSAAAAIFFTAFTFSEAAPIPRVQRAFHDLLHLWNDTLEVTPADDDLHLDGSLVPVLLIAVGPERPGQPKFFVGDEKVMLANGSPGGPTRLGSVRPAAGQQLTQWTASAVAAVEYYWDSLSDPDLNPDEWIPTLSFGDSDGNGLVVTPESTLLIVPGQSPRAVGPGVPVSAPDGKRLTLSRWGDLAARHLATTFRELASSTTP